MKVMVSCVSTDGEILGGTDAYLNVHNGRGVIVGSVSMPIVISGCVAKFTTYVPDLDVSVDHPVARPIQVIPGETVHLNMEPNHGVLLTFGK
jgi:hypothetical protein